MGREHGIILGRLVRVLAAGFLVASVTSTIGCAQRSSTTATEVGTSVQQSSLGLDEQAAIYAQAVDWAHGGAKSQSRFPVGDTVYIARATESGTFPEDLQSRLSTQLEEVSSITWVDTVEDAPRDPDTAVPEGGGVILSFGTIEVVASDTVRVPFSAYYGNLGAFGSTYLLKKVNGTWQVISTGPDEWNS